ncbi:MAG: hypothetical protein OFPI_26660 [Osedax symbiont Rs2]|nr:MAG: hypothetical protein OFPI_26660 [Osedax symbiont Rs2]
MQPVKLTPPSAVAMIRPHQFRINPQTFADNSFQLDPQTMANTLQQQAFLQVTNVVGRLREIGVKVHLFEDNSSETPDSVFPNNWFSSHAQGTICIYPMYAKNRRKERRWDLIEQLKQQYSVNQLLDYSSMEEQHLALEGTGAMVLDHVNKQAYTVRSNRASTQVLQRFCADLNYSAQVFDASDERGVAVYHTNVLMCIATDFVLIGASMIRCSQQRAQIINQLQLSGRTVIELTESQIANFCGNALELQGENEAFLALSQNAYDALSVQQRGIIESFVCLLPLQVSAIEAAGGALRCMLADIHLAAIPLIDKRH